MVLRSFILVLLSTLAAPVLVQADAISDARAAQAATTRGDHEAAINLYSRAIAAREFDLGNQAVAYYNRGLSHQRLQQLYRAIEDFSVAVALDPRQANALLLRAQIYIEWEKTDLALQDLNELLVLYPNHLESLLQRGILLARLGNNKASLRDFEQAQRLAPQEPLVLLRRAAAYAAMERFTEALADVNKVLKKNANSVLALVQRGEVYEAQGENELAINDYMAAYKLEPDNPLVLSRVARNERLYIPPSAKEGTR